MVSPESDTVAATPFVFPELTKQLIAGFNSDDPEIIDNAFGGDEFTDFTKVTTDNPCSPFFIGRQAFTRERLVQHASTFSESMDKITPEIAQRISRRTTAVGAIMTIAGIYDGLRDNAELLGLPTDLASLSANSSRLTDPALAKQSARRHLASLLAQADTVGVLGSNSIPSFASIYFNTLLAGKPAFSMEVTQKLEKIFTANFSHKPEMLETVEDIFTQFQSDDTVIEFSKHAREFSRTHDKNTFDLMNGSLEAREMALQCKDAAKQPVRLQDNAVRYAEHLLSPRVLNMFFPPQHSAEMNTAPAVVRPSLEDLHPMEVNWSPLPEGQLDEAAKAIVEKFTERHRKAPEVDMSRLDILREIRQRIGPERCYYAVGELVQSYQEAVRTATEAGDEIPEDVPDEYIMLVIQNRDDDGNIISEDIVADSPITQKNGLYIYRPDASSERYGWTTIMRLEKNFARLFGARSLPHRASKGEDLNAAMVDKAMTLLTCRPEDFHSIRFGGLRGGIRRLRLVRSAAAEAVGNATR